MIGFKHPLHLHKFSSCHLQQFKYACSHSCHHSGTESTSLFNFGSLNGEIENINTDLIPNVKKRATAGANLNGIEVWGKVTLSPCCPFLKSRDIHHLKILIRLFGSALVFVNFYLNRRISSRAHLHGKQLGIFGLVIGRVWVIPKMARQIHIIEVD